MIFIKDIFNDIINDLVNPLMKDSVFTKAGILFYKENDGLLYLISNKGRLILRGEEECM